jgi:hypothetical protein
MDKGSYESDLELDFVASQRGRGGQRGNLAKSTFELSVSR